jgi:hypothetical protein
VTRRRRVGQKEPWGVWVRRRQAAPARPEPKEDQDRT